MKLQVYGDQETEKTTYLKLTQRKNGEVGLDCVDKEGNIIRHIITITAAGTLQRHIRVRGLGFETDEEGRVVIE